MASRCGMSLPSSLLLRVTLRFLSAKGLQVCQGTEKARPCPPRDVKASACTINVARAEPICVVLGRVAKGLIERRWIVGSEHGPNIVQLADQVFEGAQAIRAIFSYKQG